MYVYRTAGCVETSTREVFYAFNDVFYAFDTRVPRTTWVNMPTSNTWYCIGQHGSFTICDITSPCILPCAVIRIQCKRVLLVRARLHYNVGRRLLLDCKLSRALDSITTLPRPAIGT